MALQDTTPIAKLSAISIVNFGENMINFEIGCREDKVTVSQMVYHFAYHIAVLLTMSGVPSQVVSMCLHSAGLKTMSLASRIYRKGFDVEVQKACNTADQLHVSKDVIDKFNLFDTIDERIERVRHE